MKQLICISCPIGCRLEAEGQTVENITVKGNLCPRGAEYAKAELTAPKRMVTASVKIEGGGLKLMPVKTREAIPKELIFDSLRLLKNIVLKAPVKVGDIVYKNILNTNIDFVATRNCEVAKPTTTNAL